LIELGGDVTREDFSVLRDAASSREVHVVKLLLAYGGDAHVAACNNEALYGAVKSGCVEMVKILVEHGADLYAPYSAEWDHFLSYQWGDVELGKDWALLLSVLSGHVGVVTYLVSEHGLDVTVQGNMAVKIAAKLGSLHMVKLLHEYGADLTVIDIR
jgi:ankyrin repeat protein